MDNSVDIATGYGLDGPGFDTCQCKIILFTTASKPTLGPIHMNGQLNAPTALPPRKESSVPVG
jgi:hypothetical protein